MSEERQLRGANDGLHSGFDWLELAQERGIGSRQARALLEQALRQTSSQAWRLQPVYEELLAAAHTRSPQPSPGKVTRTMRLEAGARGPKRASTEPGRRLLSAYLNAPESADLDANSDVDADNDIDTEFDPADNADRDAAAAEPASELESLAVHDRWGDGG
ncbi:hypothetical protein [Haliangium ochraceum]|uniref:Uncharacterized protein n=1 Tax=Haliangium ochraceum (strain DSM 14365 / JCM 11303 / SMP-2) TaxID=502025 RepID=D0LLV1_HALO1|nr:hypothetical protein [Haliangium ochraceum]ACY15129.1 hypothetical protein Hoch_2595 [Haliangium ochraceum DSM 14365]